MHDPIRSPGRRAAPALVLLFALAGSTQGAHACSTDPYIGDVCAVAMNYCPTNYVQADGRLLSFRQYILLAVIIGNQYGGDGQTTFALPDLRGRTPIGAGQGTGLQPVTWSEPQGQPTQVLDASQAPAPAHTHGATFTPSPGTVAIAFPAVAGVPKVSVALPVAATPGTTGTPSAQAAYLSAIAGTLSTQAVTFQGPYTKTRPAQPYPATLEANVTIDGAPPTPAVKTTVDMVTGGKVDVRPATAAAAAPVPIQAPALGLTMCIAYQGTFPTRS